MAKPSAVLKWGGPDQVAIESKDRVGLRWSRVGACFPSILKMLGSRPHHHREKQGRIINSRLVLKRRER